MREKKIILHCQSSIINWLGFLSTPYFQATKPWVWITKPGFYDRSVAKRLLPVEISIDVYNIRYRENHKIVFVLFSWKKRSKSSRSCLFFCLDAKEPKNQGSHCGGYGLGRYAKISENSLRSNSRDFLTLRSVDRLTPPPLGRNNWKLRIENWKFIRPDYMGVFNSPLSLGNASRGARQVP